MRVEINESIRKVTVYEYDSNIVDVSQELRAWLIKEHRLLHSRDYDFWLTPGERSATFKFYDENNDTSGKTPIGFETIFKLKWDGNNINAS
ncbi:MAG TPA: hypothetical protein VFM18_18300 [Methanosarcina sp.]|nr:hypothetical protein [Methanosarcina sp.]